MRLFRGDDTSIWQERYGDSSDGAKSVSADETYDGARAGLSGNQVAGSYTLLIDDASTFADGDCIQISRERGTGITDAVTKEFNKIISGGGTTTLTLKYPLDINYYDNGVADQAQVVEMKQYSALTIDAGFTLSAPAWDGNDGGRIPVLVNGTFTYAGDMSTDAKGFVAGPGSVDPGDTGEGTANQNQANNVNSNGNGGGGGDGGGASGGSGGGGGGYDGAGSNGVQRGSVNPGHGGDGVADVELKNHPMGAGGGSGGGDGSAQGGSGGRGAGGITVRAKTITQSGTGKIHSNASAGSAGAGGNTGCGGGGSAGGNDLGFKTATFGSLTVEALGAVGGSGTGVSGGTGAPGRNSLRYSDSYTGTATPTFNVVQDEYLSDTFAHEAVFNRTKYPVAILEDAQDEDFYRNKLNHPTSAVHSVLVSSSLEMPYNIYQYTSAVLQMLYSIVRVDARQTYTIEELEPTTWIEPTAADPSERDE